MAHGHEWFRSKELCLSIEVLSQVEGLTQKNSLFFYRLKIQLCHVVLRQLDSMAITENQL